MAAKARLRAGGSYRRVDNMRETYLEDLTRGHKLSRPIKVIAACGNGTAGAFGPEALRRIGADVIPMDDTLDFTFPKYNPNTEDMAMLHAMAKALKENGAEMALGFDGDVDRCGVVDDTGEEIFADKVGVLLARDLSSRIPNAKFVADVKSTGIYEIDPVLKANGATTDYWKTGHSYMKRRTNEIEAVAGFEKSGHYFFRAPIGRGYDDGIVAAIAILEMLDRAGTKKMSQLVADLPKTWGSPTMAPFCPDEKKYDIVDAMTKEYEALKDEGRNRPRPEDRQAGDGQRRALHAGRRHLGPDPRLVQQAVIGRGGRKPGLRRPDARDVQGPRRAPLASTPKSANTIRRFRRLRCAQALPDAPTHPLTSARSHPAWSRFRRDAGGTGARPAFR